MGRGKPKKLTPQDWELMSLKCKDSDFIRVPWDFFKLNSKLMGYVEKPPETITEFKALLILQWKFLYVKNTTDYEEDEMDLYQTSILDFHELNLPRRIMGTGYTTGLQYSLKADPEYDSFIRLPMSDFRASKGKLDLFVSAVLNTYHIDTVALLWRVIRIKLGDDVFHNNNVHRTWNKIMKEKNNV